MKYCLRLQISPRPYSTLRIENELIAQVNLYTYQYQYNYFAWHLSFAVNYIKSNNLVTYMKFDIGNYFESYMRKQHEKQGYIFFSLRGILLKKTSSHRFNVKVYMVRTKRTCLLTFQQSSTIRYTHNLSIVYVLLLT